MSRAPRYETPELREQPFACPSCKSKNVGRVRHQGENFLQCNECKWWSTKYTPENPGIFAAGT